MSTGDSAAPIHLIGQKPCGDAATHFYKIKGGMPLARSQTETITIRLTEEEKDALTEKLMRAGKPSWRHFILEMCMRGQIIVSEDLRKLNAELRRQGNNLNQLARLAHQGRIDVVDLDELLACYRQILLAIGGDSAGNC